MKYETNFSGIKYLPINSVYCFLWNDQIISIDNIKFWHDKKELQKQLDMQFNSTI